MHKISQTASCFATLALVLAGCASAGAPVAQEAATGVAERGMDAMMKMRCSLDPQDEVLLWWTGNLFAVEAQKAPRLLLRFEGYNICRAERQADGSWRLLTRELTFYRDPATGAIVDEWDNPLSGERNRVVQVANDPVNQAMGVPGRTMNLPWVQSGDTLMLQLDIPLAYPNPLTPADFPAESSGPVYSGSEHFTFFMPRAAMDDPALKQVPVSYSWTRVGPWLPWMRLGTRPGHLLYVGQGVKKDSIAELPADIRQRIARDYPQYARAPSEWTQPNATSWTEYRRLMRPATPAK